MVFPKNSKLQLTFLHFTIKYATFFKRLFCRTFCSTFYFKNIIMLLLTGNPDDPNFNPDMTYPFTDRMGINERILNILYTTYTRLYYRYWHLPKAQHMANELIPGTSVYDIDKNFSLVILGNNHVFGYPKPLLPHVIEVHSLHISGNPAPLSEVSNYNRI